MRQSLIIAIFIIAILLVLAALNAASYVRLEQSIDFEHNPDRSTYNTGGSGARALYDYLQETGNKVVRWQEPTSDLLKDAGEKPNTFIVIGKTKRRFEKEEINSLLAWVGSGGRLVLIDRYPHPDLLPPNGNWSVRIYSGDVPDDVKTDDQAAMTRDVNPVQPVQPTVLTSNVEKILPSRFIGNISLEWTGPGANKPDIESQQGQVVIEEDEEDGVGSSDYPPPPTPTPKLPSVDVTSQSELPPTAPVVHISSDGRPMLVDYPYGTGRIVVLSDPYIVSNAGIRLADNQQLALNLVARNSGTIAFDEYHQGHGSHQNRLIAYFSGTPVLAVVGQFVLLVLAIVWTQSKRFARPLPLFNPDRRSKLEYVASMAELQERARAYDLAIENIYTRLRRVLARYAGLDANARTNDIAVRVAARGKMDPHQVETVMRQSEDTINGEPIKANQALALIARLRELENRLGLRLRSREVRQLKEK